MSVDKKINYEKPVVQGGVDNYLGKQPQVQAPRKWQSGPDKPATELAYITEAEKDLILKANIHGGLEGGPNIGPSGIMSLDSFGDIGGAGAAGVDTEASGGAKEGKGFSGQAPGQDDRDFDRQKANQRAALQIAERKQAKDLGYKERANIADRTYGPLQKYTGERGFLGNLFRGANKYGYTDTYTSGPKMGQVKPGIGGRILGGLGTLLTGIPFLGGALGTMYDYGKGIVSRKPRDMTEFNKLGLYTGRPEFTSTNPTIQYDIDNQGMLSLNDIASLVKASQAPQKIDTSMYGGDLDNIGTYYDDKNNINYYAGESPENINKLKNIPANELGDTFMKTMIGPDGLTYYHNDPQKIDTSMYGGDLDNIGTFYDDANNINYYAGESPENIYKFDNIPGNELGDTFMKTMIGPDGLTYYHNDPQGIETINFDEEVFQPYP